MNTTAIIPATSIMAFAMPWMTLGSSSVEPLEQPEADLIWSSTWGLLQMLSSAKAGVKGVKALRPRAQKAAVMMVEVMILDSFDMWGDLL